jgi:hypothetical protein
MKQIFNAVTDLIQARMYMCLLGVIIVLVGMLSPQLALRCVQTGVNR